MAKALMTKMLFIILYYVVFCGAQACCLVAYSAL